ncbi:MAG: hypothetical protein VX877_00910, partial [Planctomycetota bacterium]|nr:hypothetical protein [Planctomycetota bacterium]
MSQADPQQRDVRAKSCDDLFADPRFVWCAGTGRDDDSIWLEIGDLFERDLVVPLDPDLQSRVDLPESLEPGVCV